MPQDDGIEAAAPDVGAVVIGRNEGVRLIRCLASLTGQAASIVYVDSGSTDGSVDAARKRGAQVVELDMSQPFTAARARNSGAAALPDGIEYVQFVDGDCTVRPDWIGAARAFLADRPDIAVACGRRREIAPDASIYNRLCDAEWDSPVGAAQHCGGDALILRDALRAVGGYRDDMIAGEEPEMCLRLIKLGWGVWRLDREMTLHDAAITRFGQWWTRTKRSGHAFAETAYLHGLFGDHIGVAETRRNLFWGLALPVLIALAAILLTPWALAAAAIYPAQIARLARREGGGRFGWAKAALMVIGKFAETLGAITFAANLIFRRKAKLMEYKTP